MVLSGEGQKRKYSRPTYEVLMHLSQTRMELIKMVQRQGHTIKHSAKMLNIKESTAKLIVSRYRTCGTIYEGKKKRTNRKHKQSKKREGRQMKGQQCVDRIIEQRKDHIIEAPKNIITQQHIHPQPNSQPQYSFYFDFMPILYYPLQIHPN